MSYRRLFLLYSLILILLISRSIRAAEHDTSRSEASPSASPSTTSRPAGDSKIRDKEVAILTKVIQTSEGFIRGEFSDRLPLALDRIKDGSEDEIATIMSELMGMVNDSQAETPLKDVEKEMEKEPDSRFMDLLNRLKWAKEIVKPTLSPEAGVPLCCSGAEFQKFKEAFDKAWKKTKDHNDEFYTKLDKALNGNAAEQEDAKEFLRTKYDSKALLGFIEAQRDSGNTKLANDLTKALAFEEGGSRYLDTVGKDSSKDRLHLGSDPEKLAEDLKTFSEKTKTPLNSVSFSPKKFTKPDREYRDGAFSRPVADPPAAKVPDEKAFEVMANNCVDCHGPDGSAKRHLLMGANGELSDPEQIKAAVRRATLGVDKAGKTNRFMPPGKELGITEEEKALLQDWLKGKGLSLE